MQFTNTWNRVLDLNAFVLNKRVIYLCSTCECALVLLAMLHKHSIAGFTCFNFRSYVSWTNATEAQWNAIELYDAISPLNVTIATEKVYMLNYDNKWPTVGRYNEVGFLVIP